MIFRRCIPDALVFPPFRQEKRSDFSPRNHPLRVCTFLFFNHLLLDSMENYSYIITPCVVLPLLNEANQSLRRFPVSKMSNLPRRCKAISPYVGKTEDELTFNGKLYHIYPGKRHYPLYLLVMLTPRPVGDIIFVPPGGRLC